MERFWLNTPIGLAILTSLGITGVAAIALGVIRGRRAQAMVRSAVDWPEIVVALGGFAVTMVLASYFALLFSHLWFEAAGRVLAGISGAMPVRQIAQALAGIAPWCLWFGAAVWMFRRMFRQWV